MHTHETLTVGEITDPIASECAGGQEEDEKAAKRPRVERRCGHCSWTGHNARDCQVEIVDAVEGNNSK